MKSQKEKLPMPETKRAFLVPADATKKIATVHHFYETRLIDGSVDADGKPVVEYEFVFRCFSSGVERRYGTYVPRQTASAEDDQVN